MPVLVTRCLLEAFGPLTNELAARTSHHENVRIFSCIGHISVSVFAVGTVFEILIFVISYTLNTFFAYCVMSLDDENSHPMCVG